MDDGRSSRSTGAADAAVAQTKERSTFRRKRYPAGPRPRPHDAARRRGLSLGPAASWSDVATLCAHARHPGRSWATNVSRPRSVHPPASSQWFRVARSGLRHTVPGTGTRRAVETRLGCQLGAPGTDTSSAEATAVITLAVEPPSRSPHTTLRRRLDVADDLKRSRLQRSPVSLRTLRTMPVFGKASIAYGCLCRRTAVASAVGERRAVTRRGTTSGARELVLCAHLTTASTHKPRQAPWSRVARAGSRLFGCLLRD